MYKRQQIRVIEQQRAIAQKLIDQFNRETAGEVTGLGGLTQPALGVIKAVGAFGTNTLWEFEDQIKQADGAIESQTRKLGVLKAALEAGAFAANDAASTEIEAKKKSEIATQAAADAEKALAEERLRGDISGIARRTSMNREALNLETNGTVAQIQERIKDIDRERRVILDQITQLKTLPKSDTVTKEIERLESEFRVLGATATKLGDKVLEAARAREVEAAALKKAEDARQATIKAMDDYQSAQKDMIALQREHTKALEAEKTALERTGIERGFEKRIAEATERQRLQEAEADATMQALKTNADFYAQQRDAQADYQRDALRAEQDFGRERTRMIEDLNADLLDLASERDVAGFIRRQRQGNTDLTRGAEDSALESRRRAEDFERQRAEENAAREATLADIRANLETSRKVQVSEAERLRNQLSSIQARWAEMDRVSLHNEREKAYRDQLDQLRRFAQASVNLVAQMARAVQLTPTTRGGSAFGPVLTANAEGGIYSSPTLGLLGERRGWMDFVLPVRQGEGCLLYTSPSPRD